MAADLFLLPFRPAFTPDGKIAPGAKLYFYQHQTFDAYPVYTDASLTIELPNPVTANAAGIWPNVYLDDSLVYRVVLRDKNDVILNDVDPYLPNTLDGLTEDLEDLASQVASNLEDAQEAADRAYGYAAAIETVTAGYWYATLADGIADTSTGESFLIVTTDGHVQIGYNDGASGVIRAEFATTANAILPTKDQLDTILDYSSVVDTLLGSTTKAELRANSDAAQNNANTDITSLRSSVTISEVGNQTGSQLGFRGTPSNVQSTAYQIVISDIGKRIDISSGGVTIPANSSVAFPTDTVIAIYNNSSSSQAISILTDTLRLAGTTTTGNRTLAAYGLATIMKVGTTTWVISGNVT